MNVIFESWREITLTENHLKQLHSLLLKFSTKDAAHRGHYKKLSNNVVAFDADGREIGFVFATETPFATPGAMQKLVAWTNDALKNKNIHPLLIIAVFVVVFLAIRGVSRRQRAAFQNFDDAIAAANRLRIRAGQLA